ncbi:MAG: hypothetical protein M1839_002758 [Geoglossum umbratile]|nr:MAG: hypothetical protein M1839_002758 [Geoglossum umbratile]
MLRVKLSGKNRRKPIKSPLVDDTPPVLEDFYELDQEGDIVLVLSIPREEPIAVNAPSVNGVATDIPKCTTEPEEYAHQGGSPRCEVVSTTDYECVPDQPQDHAYQDDHPDCMATPTADYEPICVGPPEEATPTDVISLASEGDIFTLVPTETNFVSPPASETPSVGHHRTVSFLVSSAHLRLASPVFSELLKKHRVHASGGTKHPITIPLRDDDPHILLIFLNILHHHTRKVPDRLSLEKLAGIGILVEKYKCVEVVEGLSRVWWTRGEMRDMLPKSMGVTLLRFLYVSWLFKIPDQFDRASLVVIRESGGEYIKEQPSDFTLPDSILAAVHTRREAAIASLLASLQDLLSHYEITKPPPPQGDPDEAVAHSCGTRLLCRNDNPDCDAMVLGYLHKGMKAIGLLHSPEPPYEGWSFASLVADIGGMGMPRSCPSVSRGLNSWGAYVNDDDNTSCFGGPLEDIDLETALKGLKLSDFQED